MAIFCGRETLRRHVIDGLHTDAITLVAEVIESKVKPTQPSGDLAQSAFGTVPVVTDRGAITQSILAIGIQDIDPCGLRPPDGTEILGASSDHLITTSTIGSASVGAEMTFQLDYSALVRAMTSPFVTKSLKSAGNTSSLRQTA
jgi:predicted amino acid racemase